MEIQQLWQGLYSGSKNFSQQQAHTANATGFGAAADDYAERGIDLNEEIIRNKPATFFMRAGSNSMEATGIRKGDVLVVDKSLAPRHGSIVIAVSEGQMLLRRLHLQGHQHVLVEECKNGRSAPLLNDTEIWGTVTWVLHPLN